jgi:hypothetical protein
MDDETFSLYYVQKFIGVSGIRKEPPILLLDGHGFSTKKLTADQYCERRQWYFYVSMFTAILYTQTSTSGCLLHAAVELVL